MKNSDHPPVDPKAKSLGNRLRADREMAGLSIRAAALKAEISSAYLSQLEAGGVKGPSPHILHRLSEIFGSSYSDLMRLAGYVVPGVETASDSKIGSLDFVLRSQTALSDAEREALAEYLAWYRSRHGRPPEDL